MNKTILAILAIAISISLIAQENQEKKQDQKPVLVKLDTAEAFAILSERITLLNEKIAKLELENTNLKERARFQPQFLNWDWINATAIPPDSNNYNKYPNGLKTIILPSPGLYKVFLTSLHQHGCSYREVATMWEIGGTAKRLDNGNDMSNWGVNSISGNGAYTVLVYFLATQEGQTITLMPIYRINYGAGLGAKQNFYFNCLVEKSSLID